MRPHPMQYHFGIKAAYSQVYNVTERGKQAESKMPMLGLSRDTLDFLYAFSEKKILPLKK